MLVHDVFEPAQSSIQMMDEQAVCDARDEMNARTVHSEKRENRQALCVPNGRKGSTRRAVGQKNAMHLGAVFELVADPRGRGDLIVLMREDEKARRDRCPPKKSTTARRRTGA